MIPRLNRSLPTPCRRQDHSMVRAGTGHIEEENPIRHCQLHAEGKVIQQATSAKGSMRKEIIKELFISGCAESYRSLRNFHLRHSSRVKNRSWGVVISRKESQKFRASQDIHPFSQDTASFNSGSLKGYKTPIHDVQAFPPPTEVS